MTLATSAAPPYAFRIWASGSDIYLELPGRCGPYISRYTFDAVGLSKILSLLGAARVDYDYQGAIPDGYLKPSKEPGTHNQRAAAEALIARDLSSLLRRRSK